MAAPPPSASDEHSPALRPMARAAAEAGAERPSGARPERKSLSSVATAVAVLKAFSEDEAELGVSALSKRLGVAKSTIHRLAVTLVSEGLLEQNPETGKYRLGIGLFGLGALVRRRMNVASEARPHLFRLREGTGETVQLALLDRGEMVYVYDLESPHAIRMRSDLGARKPSTCTAEGLAVLAFQPDAVVREVVGRGLAPRTPRTTTNPAELWAALERVRRQGYAIEDEQSEVGMRSVAAPIRNDGGVVFAAVGVAGPVQRLSDAVLSGFAPMVVETADTISLRIGHRSAAF